jgi:hypothetical protein
MHKTCDNWNWEACYLSQKSHMSGMSLKPNEVVEKGHLMHVPIASPQHTTFK